VQVDDYNSGMQGDCWDGWKKTKKWKQRETDDGRRDVFSLQEIKRRGIATLMYQVLRGHESGLLDHLLSPFDSSLGVR